MHCQNYRHSVGVPIKYQRLKKLAIRRSDMIDGHRIGKYWETRHGLKKYLELHRARIVKTSILLSSTLGTNLLNTCSVCALIPRLFPFRGVKMLHFGSRVFLNDLKVSLEKFHLNNYFKM